MEYEIKEYYDQIKNYKNKELRLILNDDYYFKRSNKKQLLEECLYREYYKILLDRINNHVFNFNKEFKYFKKDDIIIKFSRYNNMLQIQIQIKEEYENTRVWYDINSNIVSAGGVGRSKKIERTEDKLINNDEYYLDFQYIGEYTKKNFCYDWNDLKSLINTI